MATGFGVLISVIGYTRLLLARQLPGLVPPPDLWHRLGGQSGRGHRSASAAAVG